MSTERKPWRVPEGWVERTKEQLLYEAELERRFQVIKEKERKKDPNPYKQLLYEVELERRVQVMKEKERERDIMWWEMQPDNKTWIEIVG